MNIFEYLGILFLVTAMVPSRVEHQAWVTFGFQIIFSTIGAFTSLILGEWYKDYQKKKGAKK